MRKTNDPIPSPIVILLRRATIEDATKVFEWRNDPEVRSVSEFKKIITERIHLKWFAERLPMTHPESIWMITQLSDIDDDNGKSIGTARIKLEGRRYARISIVVAPEYRGRGLGRQVIKQLRSKIENMKRIAVASVQVGNIPSLRAFMASGFHIIKTREAVVDLQAMTDKEYQDHGRAIRKRT